MTLSAGEALENIVANVQRLTGDHEPGFAELTIADIARRSGVPRAKVAEVLGGRLYPCPRDLAAMASTLHVTAHELVTEPPL